MKENRLARERKTISVMITMYCRDLHGGKNAPLCRSCAGLREYAMERINRCPFLDDKPTCLKCPVHCYSQKKREEVRQVMRYAGPRMLLRHPYLAVMHLIDGKFAGKKSRVLHESPDQGKGSK